LLLFAEQQNRVRKNKRYLFVKNCTLLEFSVLPLDGSLMVCVMHPTLSVFSIFAQQEQQQQQPS